MRRGIVVAFVLILGLVLAACEIASSAPFIGTGGARQRGLTAGERAMLEPIFGHSINYDRVRVIQAALPLQPPNMYMTPRGHIYAPGDLFIEDWSAAGVTAKDRAHFVHEMVHVWQHGQGIDVMAGSLRELVDHRGDYHRSYAYTLKRGRAFTSYGIEQQASILGDYFRISIGMKPRDLANRKLSRRERDRLYASMLRTVRGEH